MSAAPGTDLVWPHDPSGRDTFVRMSAALTGFGEVELWATGMVDDHLETLVAIVGEELTARMLTASAGGVERLLADDDLGDPARSLVSLWYLGQWDQLGPDWRDAHGASGLDRTRVVSARAFEEGLVWSAIGAHPPGAKQTGFGSWALPPGRPSDVTVRGRRADP